MAEDIEGVVLKVIKRAKAGDMTAARLILDRIVPQRKGCPVAFELPTVETTADITKAFRAIIGAMASGDLTPDEATSVAGVIEAQRKGIETTEFEVRLQALEERMAQNESTGNADRCA